MYLHWSRQKRTPAACKQRLSGVSSSRLSRNGESGQGMHADLSEMTALTDRLSPERLSSYVVAGGGDIASALDLYVWNSALSASLGTTIGHVEVVLRNAIHESLTAWSTRRFDEPRWYLDPGGLFQSRQIDAIHVAQQRVTRHGRHTETPGRVVAQLPFGFWRVMLAGQYDTTLWRQSLYHAFPGQRRRRVIQDAVEVLRLSRNRLAHHEPMFNRPIADIHVTALELVGWICPISRNWIERHSSVLQVLGRRATSAARVSRRRRRLRRRRFAAPTC